MDVNRDPIDTLRSGAEHYAGRLCRIGNKLGCSGVRVCELLVDYVPAVTYQLAITGPVIGVCGVLVVKELPGKVVTGILFGAAAIGPYPNVMKDRVGRVVQNLTMNISKQTLREDFFPLDSLESQDPTRVTDNGHPVAGAIRDCARRTIDQALLAAGRTKLEISPAKVSSTRGKIVQYYAPSDLGFSLADDAAQSSDVIVGIDVDYYFADVGKIFQYGLPCVFHSFQPVKVSGADGDCHYRIVDNRVDYSVGGGNKWSHEIWDWCAAGEFVETKVTGATWPQWFIRKFFGVFGLQQVLITKVHHARPWPKCPGRLFVWTTPEVSFWEWVYYPRNVRGRQLKRVVYAEPNKPGWNVVVYHDQVGDLLVNFGRAGEDASVTIDKADFDVLMGCGTPQSVTTRAMAMGYLDSSVLALVAQFFAGKPALTFTPPRVERSVVPVAVHWAPASLVDVPECSFRNYSAPLVVDHNLAPMIKRWEAMSLSVDRRVEDFSNAVKPGSRIQQYACEWAAILVPNAGVGHPYTVDKAIELLSKPSQVLAVKAIWDSVDGEIKSKIESFMKNEPCMKPGRIISSYPDVRYLIMFTQFTQKYRDEVLHSEANEHWFCPGMTPERIAEKVCTYAGEVSAVGETDFTNLDGSTSSWLQLQVYVACLKRYFHVSHHPAITEYARRLLAIPAYAKRFNFKYDPGVGVKSGSPPTCDQNTHTSGFVEYCALRDTYRHLNPEQCFSLLGPKFGDDGITRMELKGATIRNCNALGLTIKFETCTPESGVTFLARVYPDPRVTNTTFQDPLRTLRKLHMTARDPNIPLPTACLDRLDGYLITDGETPVISDYCRAMVRLYQPAVNHDANRGVRVSKDKEKSYWLTQGGNWPQDPKDRELMLNCISHRVGYPVEVLEAFSAQFERLTSPWNIIPLPMQSIVSPYKDTLMDDGLPADVVDPRLLLKDVKKVQLRATPELTRGGSNGGTPSRGGAAKSRGGRRSNPERPAQPDRLLNNNRIKVEQSDKRNLGKTKNVRGAKGTTATRNQPEASGATRGPQSSARGTRRGINRDTR